MGAGQPNWQKLHAMGKLPKEARNNVPALVLLDTLEAKVAEFKQGACPECQAKFFGEKPIESKVDVKTEPEITVTCPVEGCDYQATGQSEAVANNRLRMHNKTHEVKAEETKV